MRRWMGLIVLWCGCGRSHSVTDGGFVCFDDPMDPAAEAAPLVAGEPFALYAQMGLGCNTVVDGMTCVVDVDGTDIFLTTVTDFTTPGRLPFSGIEMCMRVASSDCDVPALEEGTYTVHYGNSSRPLDLPGEPWAECLGANDPDGDEAE